MRNVESKRDSKFFIRSDPCFFPAHAFPVEQWQCQLALFLGSDINERIDLEGLSMREFTFTGATCRRNAWIQLCIQSYRGEEQKKSDISAGGNNS
jgi:hypothetical protein